MAAVQLDTEAATGQRPGIKDTASDWLATVSQVRNLITARRYLDPTPTLFLKQFGQLISPYVIIISSTSLNRNMQQL